MIERPLSKDIFECLMSNVVYSDCLIRKYSSAIIKDNQIIGFGHSLIANNEKCDEAGVCLRKVLQNKYGNNFDFFEVCPIIHAEMSAILSCENIKSCNKSTLYLLGINQQDSTIYKNAFPCPICLRHIIHVGIRTICVVQNEYTYHEFTFREGEFQ